MKKLLVLAVTLLGLACVIPANAVVTTTQVTIGSTATQVATVTQYCSWVVLQNNNASDTVRVGDSTVSSTTGILLSGGAPGGSFYTSSAGSTKPVNLSTWYVFGTNGDKLDVTCDTVTF